MDFISNFKGGYDGIWKAIIRPEREEYIMDNLGPAEFRLRDKKYKRTDLQITNKRGLTLECSHFEPVKRIAKQLPCVIYLHGNASSRLEALHTIEALLPVNITLFCFDFAGCGKSQGDYISLGWHERDDVDSVINYLRESGTVSTIGLWGRSMGAVSALMHADRDPSIAGIVADSSFSDMRKLTEELIKNHTKLPKLVVSGAMSLIKKTIKSKGGFDLDSLVPLNNVSESFMPALFVAGKEDKYIDPRHTKDLFDRYAGEKKIILVDGDHHSARPQFLLDSIAIFFYNTLMVELIPNEELYCSGEDVIEENQGNKDNIEDEEYDEINPELLKSKVGRRDFEIEKAVEKENVEDLAKFVEASLKIEAQEQNQVQEEEKQDTILEMPKEEFKEGEKKEQKNEEKEAENPEQKEEPKGEEKEEEKIELLKGPKMYEDFEIIE